MDDFEDFENMFPIDSPKKIKSDAELLREQNIKEREAFFASLLKDPEFAEAMDAINSAYKERSPKRHSSHKVKRKKTSRDETARFLAKIPTERRKSSRLRNVAPLYSESDLIDDSDIFMSRQKNVSSLSGSDFEDIEDVVYVPKTQHKRGSGVRNKHVFIPVEEVTNGMLERVAKRVIEKVYAENGSSCHQCRQKTKDQKTSCRNNDCFGVRGQFCGVCLENRYGEDAVQALKDPNWHCPVCRGICNCSFCRAKEGKRPTGILAPLAQKYGHKSVKHFLDSLNGEGDYADEHKNPKNLLGFSKDLSCAQMGGKVKYHFDNIFDSKKFTECIEELERKLVISRTNESVYLLGFENNMARLEIGI